MWKNNTYQTNYLRIQLTNTHIHYPGEWVIHVREFGWNTKPIGLKSEESESIARIKSLQIVRNHILKMLKSLPMQTMEQRLIELLVEFLDNNGMYTRFESYVYEQGGLDTEKSLEEVIDEVLQG